jgi:type 1 glutamine amidotransferase
MKRLLSPANIVLPLLFVLFMSGCGTQARGPLTRVLIMSGRNNHEWQRTTPVIERILSNRLLFRTDVTFRPDTLSYADLSRYDAVISNWNSWPDTVTGPGTGWETAFMKFIRKGGGAVFIHAGASSFYKWEDYHRIGIGRWGKATRHGAQTIGRVTSFDQKHPVTNGFSDFLIFDELWEKTDIINGAECIARVKATDNADGHSIDEGSVFVNHTGRGRSFYTTLGHNERAMLNSGFQILLQRAVQWVAGKQITVELPREISVTNHSSGQNFNWTKSDSSLALKDDSAILWQLNFRNRYGRPYFHPVSVRNSVLTCVSPPDHPWHLGLWFCWKFINNINYWEYTEGHSSEETGFRSAGITSTDKISTDCNQDFSADISMELTYRPAESEAVMSEYRKIHVSQPFPDGSYYIDEDHLFTALADQTILDRTPLESEPGGRPWGGYAGLSVRFSQDFTSPMVMAPDTSSKCRKNKWVYMGFTTLSGVTAGMCIFQDPVLTTPVTSWYIIKTTEIPFFYYSPAVIYDGKIVLKKGDKLHLRYRTWIIGGKPDPADLQAKYNEFAASGKK